MLIDLEEKGKKEEGGRPTRPGDWFMPLVPTGG